MNESFMNRIHRSFYLCQPHAERLSFKGLDDLKNVRKGKDRLLSSRVADEKTASALLHSISQLMAARLSRSACPPTKREMRRNLLEFTQSSGNPQVFPRV